MKAAVRKELCGSQEFLVLHSSNSRASPLHVLATQGTARLAQVRSRMKTLGSLKRLDGGLATWAVRGSLALVVRRKKTGSRSQLHQSSEDS